VGQIVIACYRPKPGAEGRLVELTRTHVPRLRELGLATAREPIAMRAEDGTVVEVFEWVSAEAIASAHTNPAVLAMWEEFGAVCDYVPITAVAGIDRPFAGFTPLDLSSAAST